MSAPATFQLTTRLEGTTLPSTVRALPAGPVRVKLERTAVVLYNALARLAFEGFRVTAVVHEQQVPIVSGDLVMALEEAFVADECGIRLLSSTGNDTLYLRVVLGNEPEEVVADTSYPLSSAPAAYACDAMWNTIGLLEDHYLDLDSDGAFGGKA